MNYLVDEFKLTATSPPSEKRHLFWEPRRTCENVLLTVLKAIAADAFSGGLPITTE